MSETLKIICADLPAPPLFWKDNGYRYGYEADLSRAIAKEMNKECEFVYCNWADFYPHLQSGAADMLLCGQGISDYRKTLADFSEPYAVFDEAVMVLRDSSVTDAKDLSNKKVGAIANSVNMALAETFDGAKTVSFAGVTDDVMGEMVEALRNQEIDAFVDDDVALIPLANELDLKIAFVHPSQNKWGIAIKKGNLKLKQDINNALNQLKSNGILESIWVHHMPGLSYPFSN